MLLRVAPHLVWPPRFVMPHVPELRPRWMIRAGLFLYDHLARRSIAAAARTAVRLDRPPYGAGLKPRAQARLRLFRLPGRRRAPGGRQRLDARQRGARVLDAHRMRRARGASDGRWQRRARRAARRVQARARIVNAAGPWVKRC